MVAKAVQNESQMQAKCKPNAGIMWAFCHPCSCHCPVILWIFSQQQCSHLATPAPTCSCLCPVFVLTLSEHFPQNKARQQSNHLSFAPHPRCKICKIHWRIQPAISPHRARCSNPLALALSLPDCRLNPQQRLPCIGSNSTTSYKFIAQAPNQMQCPKSCFQPAAMKKVLGFWHIPTVSQDPMVITDATHSLSMISNDAVRQDVLCAYGHVLVPIVHFHFQLSIRLLFVIYFQFLDSFLWFRLPNHMHACSLTCQVHFYKACIIC